MRGSRGHEGGRRFTRVAACACVGAAAVASLAGARPTAGAADLKPVAGSGTFTFSGKGNFGTVKGTVKTTAVPSSIAPGEPVRLTMEISWTETGQAPQCYPGTIDGQTHQQSQFPIVTIRPGHGEDLAQQARVVDATGDTTVVWGDNVTTCGATDTVTQTDSYDARVSGSETKSYVPSCISPFPSAGTNVFGNLGPDATFDGTFATVSIGGADCFGTGGSVSSTQTTTDTFTAPGQAKPHAVTVPANRTKAELNLRWAKPTDRFTVAGVVLTPKRKTSAVSQSDKLKITFFARTGTSLGVRITNLSPGKLTYRIVATKVSGKATVRTKTVLKA